MSFEPGFSGQVDGDSSAYWLLFKGNEILTLEDQGQFALPDLDLYKSSMKLVRKQYLGRVEGRSCYAAELTPDTAVQLSMLVGR